MIAEIYFCKGLVLPAACLLTSFASMLPELSQKKRFVRQKFSRVTRRYDLVNTLGSFGLDHWWRYRLVQKIGSYTGPILDLCAGTLTLAKEIVRQRPRPVIALDITLEMLAYGKFRLASHPATSFIFLVQGDAENLPFPKEIFSAVTVAFGIRNLPHPDRCFTEVFRVLKPGGKFVILEFSRPKTPIFASLYRFYLFHFMPLLGGSLTGDREAYEYLARSIESFPSPREICYSLEAAGFREVNFENLTFGVVSIYQASKI